MCVCVEQMGGRGSKIQQQPGVSWTGNGAAVSELSQLLSTEDE